jgi:hypothetical protein
MNIRIITFITLTTTFLIGLSAGYFIGLNTQKNLEKQKELYFRYELNKIG